jgi:hypothetical protein
MSLFFLTMYVAEPHRFGGSQSHSLNYEHGKLFKKCGAAPADPTGGYEEKFEY